MADYLNIPLRLKEIMNKKDLPKVDLMRSIHNMIHLIIITSYNEVKHDPSFGTEISNYDFENIYNTHYLKSELEKSLLDSIRNNEKRLNDVKISLQIDQVEFTGKVRKRRVKTQIRMVITGVVDKTNEQFRHSEAFFIGPLSYY